MPLRVSPATAPLPSAHQLLLLRVHLVKLRLLCSALRGLLSLLGFPGAALLFGEPTGIHFVRLPLFPLLGLLRAAPLFHLCLEGGLLRQGGLASLVLGGRLSRIAAIDVGDEALPGGAGVRLPGDLGRLDVGDLGRALGGRRHAHRHCCWLPRGGRDIPSARHGDAGSDEVVAELEVCVSKGLSSAAAKSRAERAIHEVGTGSWLVRHRSRPLLLLLLLHHWHRGRCHLLWKVVGTRMVRLLQRRMCSSLHFSLRLGLPVQVLLLLPLPLLLLAKPVPLHLALEFQGILLLLLSPRKFVLLLGCEPWGGTTRSRGGGWGSDGVVHDGWRQNLDPRRCCSRVIRREPLSGHA